MHTIFLIISQHLDDEIHSSNNQSEMDRLIGTIFGIASLKHPHVMYWQRDYDSQKYSLGRQLSLGFRHCRCFTSGSLSRARPLSLSRLALYAPSLIFTQWNLTLHSLVFLPSEGTNVNTTGRNNGAHGELFVTLSFPSRFSWRPDWQFDVWRCGARAATLDVQWTFISKECLTSYIDMCTTADMTAFFSR